MLRFCLTPCKADSEVLMAVACFTSAFCSLFMVRSTTIIWSSEPEQGGAYDRVIGRESHRGMSQVRPSALKHLSGKAWDPSAGQT